MQFSLHRVWLLCRKQWTENKQLYVLGALATAGIILAVVIFDLAQDSSFGHRDQQFTLYIGALLSGSIFTSTILSQFSDKTKSMQALMLPASTMEKLAAALFCSLVVFLGVYLLITYPLISIGYYFDTQIMGRVSSLYSLTLNEDNYYFIIIFLVVQSFALLGSVLFKRYVYIKSVILVLVIFYGIQLINPVIVNNTLKKGVGTVVKADAKVVLHGKDDTPAQLGTEKATIYPEMLSTGPYRDVRFFGNPDKPKYYGGNSYTASVVVLSNPYNAVFIILLYLAIPFLWVITWFKLSEKQL